MKLNCTLMRAMVLAILAAFTIGTAHAQTKPVKILQNNDTLITANRTWDCDTIYYMKGHIFVTNGAELTIQPGTVIVGDSITKGALIITKGSKIHAIGTASCPIVFTSPKNPNKRKRGDWGGVILLGKASLNTPTGLANIEGLPPSPLTEYGGGTTPDDNDNSGELEFVRSEFAGVALSPNNEINGLTFGAVGRGTKIDFVQVSYANDDSFEWFGGTVNCTHLIAFRGIDDDFDTDNGYSGKCQFGIGIRDPAVADVSGSSGYESDNDANSSTNLPQTRAIFCNFTVEAGADTTSNPLFRDGARIRRNSHMYMYNSILMGYPAGVTIDGALTDANVLADTMVQNDIITCLNSSKYVVSVLGNAGVTNLLLNHASNRFFAGNTQVLLSNPYNLNNPNLRPATGSPALTGASFNHVGVNDPFFVHTTFVGALAKQAAQNWATTWVNWTPTKTIYTGPCACSTGIAASADQDEDAATAAIAEVKVSPNPSHGNFNVEVSGFTGRVVVKVSNMNGSVIFAKEITGGTKNLVNVSLNRAQPGLYYVTVNDDKSMVTSKVSVN